MSVVRINIVLPPDTADAQAKRVSVEIWDASLADAPAELVANKLLHDVDLPPNGALETELETPQAGAQQVLIARAHISFDGSGEIKPGDLLTTSFVEVPPNLGSKKLTLPVSRIT